MGAIDMSNFYIHNDLNEYQYMRFHIIMIPQDTFDEYNLQDIVDSDGWCYAEIRKAMYGLKESGFIANQELKIVLAKAGYVPTKFTPGLYTHKTRPIAFSLVVDDSGVKYVNKEDMDHLISTNGNRYPIKVDWKSEYFFLNINQMRLCKQNSNIINAGVLRMEVHICERARRRVIHRIRKVPSKLSRIEIENYHIIMTMGMYRIEPPWVSICLIHTYKTKYRYLYS
jgi:hypothetical protein